METQPIENSPNPTQGLNLQLETETSNARFNYCFVQFMQRCIQAPVKLNICTEQAQKGNLIYHKYLNNPSAAITLLVHATRQELSEF